MKLEKIQYISFQSVEEAILIAEFLKGLGFKLDKRCFEKEYYTYEYKVWQGNIIVDDLRFSGFARIENEWRAMYDSSPIFTYKAEGKKLIRREKLNRLNIISENE